MSHEEENSIDGISQDSIIEFVPKKRSTAKKSTFCTKVFNQYPINRRFYFFYI